MKQFGAMLISLTLIVVMAGCAATDAAKTEKEPVASASDTREARANEDESSKESRKERKAREEEQSEADSSQTDTIVGRWSAYHVEGMGISVSLEEFKNLTGMEMDITFEFKEKGRVVGSVMGESGNGTYKVNGNIISVTFDGETEEMIMDGDKLTLEMEGMLITFYREGTEPAAPSTSTPRKAADGDVELVGKWTAARIEMEGISLELDSYMQMTGEEMIITFEFKENGIIEGVVMDESAVGTYKVSGDNIIVTFEGESEVMTLQGSELVLEIDGIRVIMTK